MGSPPLVDYFEQRDIARLEERSFIKATPQGLFLPLMPSLALDILAYAVEKGYLRGEGLFLDAGSGDGRIVGLASSLGMRSLGIEYDSDLAAESARTLEGLKKQGCLDGIPADIRQGNFLEDETYAAGGHPFGAVTAFFNYKCNGDSLASKIDACSPPGTHFLYVASIDSWDPFPRLESLFVVDQKYFSSTPSDPRLSGEDCRPALAEYNQLKLLTVLRKD